jgi:hypothetical protein
MVTYSSRSRAPAWERHYRQTSGLPPLDQGIQLNQVLPPGIIPGDGVDPIFRPGHHPEAHRVVMEVLDLLLQHRLRDDLLGMKPFLPDLVVAPGFGRLLMILQLIQDPGLLIMLQLGDDALGGVTLEIPDELRQFVPRDHQVQMVVQDDLGIEL